MRVDLQEQRPLTNPYDGYPKKKIVSKLRECISCFRPGFRSNQFLLSLARGAGPVRTHVD